MNGRAGIFAHFMKRSKKLFNDLSQKVSEASKDVSEKLQKLDDDDHISKDDVLLHLNLLHSDADFSKDYEKPQYKYFITADEEEKEESQMIDYIFVVGFDHKIGSIIEFIYPEPDENVIDDGFKKALTFIGLPDGSHMLQNDYTFFVVPDKNGQLFYGVS